MLKFFYKFHPIFFFTQKKKQTSYAKKILNKTKVILIRFNSR